MNKKKETFNTLMCSYTNDILSWLYDVDGVNKLRIRILYKYITLNGPNHIAIFIRDIYSWLL